MAASSMIYKLAFVKDCCLHLSGIHLDHALLEVLAGPALNISVNMAVFRIGKNDGH